MAEPNPFVGLRADTHKAIETMLASLYASGEWGDEEDELLAQWRDARGDDAMCNWRWWVGAPDDDLFAEDADTREAAIEIGRREYAEGGRIEIIEARMWNDDVQGDEDCSFAETRNREVLDV